MVNQVFLRKSFYLILLLFLFYSCGKVPDGNISLSETGAKLDPDYSSITIPPNIAPLNFLINEPGVAFFVRLSSGNGNNLEIYSSKNKIIIPQKKWGKFLLQNKGIEYSVEIFSKDLTGKWLKFKPFTNRISTDPVDPYLYYRLLFPGYESWSELSINQRNLSSFKTEALIENTVVDENCVNCHAFNNGKSDNFLFHMRGSMGGTYFYSDGNFKKVNLKTKEMKNGAVYPRWHPSGKYVAFSSNKIIQRFHAVDNKKVEVSDLESSLVLYDVDRNEMMDIDLKDKEKYMDTFPEWSPDGNFLYFCRADQIGEDYDHKQIKYNLYRVAFDQATLQFGEAELIFDAKISGKSISFPRISPDGRFLVLTLVDYGTFSIWHKEADLYSINLKNFESTRLSLNSDLADSYHSWSSNGKWLVFSSKRGDGLTARPYIAYIEEDGTSEKPFILPQKDPEFYSRFLKSFNIPEFSTVEVELNPGQIRKLAEKEAIQAKWHDDKVR